MSIWAVLDPAGREGYLRDQAQAGYYGVHYSIYSAQEPIWSTDPADNPRGDFPATRVRISPGSGPDGTGLQDEAGAAGVPPKRSLLPIPGLGSLGGLPSWFWWAMAAGLVLLMVSAGPDRRRVGR